MSTKDKATKFFRLSSAEQSMLIRSACRLPLIALGLRTIGFEKTRAVLLRYIPDVRWPVTHDALDPETLARVVRIAARHGAYRARCLEESLLLWWLLRRRGHPATLRIGVNKDDKTIRAHAWVELAGRVLNDDNGVKRRFPGFERDLGSPAASAR
jgi:hypothetical protein